MKFISAFSFLCAAMLVTVAPTANAQDQSAPVSTCLAVAQSLPPEPKVIFAAASSNPLSVDGNVTIEFAGHSTYRIETPAGVAAATDFAGFFGASPTQPNIATMNRAHSSHFTTNPDPAIEYVLTGWNPNDIEPIDHDLVVEDIYVRNVTTDIRSFGEGMIADGNSIFIFEVAGLCIGHLGHLHHPLTNDHFAEIGRLDVLMVPVDGGLTLSHAAMAEITTRLRSSIVLPMHLRGNRIDSFISRMGPDWDVDFLSGDKIEINVRNLPKRPTIMVPQSLRTRG